MKKRVLVAMSGGVDSATTAALLKEQGFDVIGVTMQLWDYGDAEGGCCSVDDVRDARRVADQIGIKHYVVNYMDKFKEYIVSDFINKYMGGKTPSPCVLCNEYMKFDFLMKRALELGADFMATGHYARIVYDDINEIYYLQKAVDKNKDQSYFLFTLKQKELAKILFPLGDKKKDEVREIAENLNLKVARKPDSQGVCFITGKSYKDFLKSHMNTSNKSGEIVDTGGNVIGHHEGIFSYTVGQRRGLGIAKGKPLYVVNIDTKNNRVIVGSEQEIYSRSLSVNNISWVSDIIYEDMYVSAKIRYRHKENDAKIQLKRYDEAIVNFNEPQRAITPGQAIVFYNHDRVIGGGWINKVIH
jgi:tRNA-uridine 2-sulfurtransferase